MSSTHLFIVAQHFGTILWRKAGAGMGRSSGSLEKKQQVNTFVFTFIFQSKFISLLFTLKNERMNEYLIVPTEQKQRATVNLKSKNNVQ